MDNIGGNGMKRKTQASRQLRGVGLVPGVGSGAVVFFDRMGATGEIDYRGRIVIRAELPESDAASLARSKPAAIVFTGPDVSPRALRVLRRAGIPAVDGIDAHFFSGGTAQTAVVDGSLGSVWANAVLVPAGAAVK